MVDRRAYLWAEKWAFPTVGRSVLWMGHGMVSMTGNLMEELWEHGMDIQWVLMKAFSRVRYSADRSKIFGATFGVFSFGRNDE